MTRPRLLILAAVVGVLVVAVVVALVVRQELATRHLVMRAQVDVNGVEIVDDSAPVADPRGDGRAVCVPLSLALAGAFTGPDSAVSNGIRSGVQLAVDGHNTANPGCQVQIKEFDTQGDPGRLSTLAPEIVSDAYTLGMIGPTFSEVMESTGEVFSRNRLATATASATDDSLSQHGWNTFFRAIANDDAQARAAANILTKMMRASRVCVVDDGTPFAITAAGVATATLGAAGITGCRVSIRPDGTDSTHAVNVVKDAGPDAVAVIGAAQDAARLARDLHDGGVDAEVVALGDVADDGFLRLAGGAADRLRMVCPCAPAPASFVGQYREKFHRDVGAYTAEGYDLATIMLKAIDAGVLTRPQMLDWMHRYRGRGVARWYQWTPAGELINPTVWIYQAA